MLICAADNMDHIPEMYCNNIISSLMLTEKLEIPQKGIKSIFDVFSILAMAGLFAVLQAFVQSEFVSVRVVK